eukprot:1265646-Pleurochrysis_carterae.AAC.1
MRSAQQHADPLPPQMPQCQRMGTAEGQMVFASAFDGSGGDGMGGGGGMDGGMGSCMASVMHGGNTLGLARMAPACGEMPGSIGYGGMGGMAGGIPDGMGGL